MTKTALAIVALLGVTLVVLALDPQLDLDIARRFYVGTAHFVGATPAGVLVRYAAWALPFVVYVALLLAALGARLGLVAARFAPRPRSLLFLTLAFALGPGLLVHATLKELSHRPRPYATQDFGGQDTFRPFTRFDGACRHNCSFPSGETTAATWMLAPASLVPPPWQGLAVAAALAFAAATGLLRMAFGAHFLSDVCGAALITMVLVLLLRWAILERGQRKDRPRQT